MGHIDTGEELDYLDDTALTEDIPLMNGRYTVTIQVYRGAGSEDIQNALMGGRKATQRITGKSDAESAVEQQIDGNALQRRTLVHGILHWTLQGKPEPKGVVWPIDEAHIMLLSAAHRAELFKAVQKLNSPLDPNSDSSG